MAAVCQPTYTSQPAPPGGGCRVLIVEDDVSIGDALRSILTRKGCEVTVARTLFQGLKALAQRPNYIVLDLMLPDGDGIEILRAIHNEQHPMRVVVTTAITDARRLQEVQALSPHRILRKPIDLVDLLGAIGMI